MERAARALNIGILVVIGLLFLDKAASYFFLRLFQGGAENAVFVSPVQLLATPGRYNGRKIFTSGYLVLEQENNNLYVSEQAAQYTTLDRLDVVFFDTTLPRGDLPGFNRQWVALSGTFWSNEPSPYVVELMEGIRKPVIREITLVRVLEESTPSRPVIPLPAE